MFKVGEIVSIIPLAPFTQVMLNDSYLVSADVLIQDLITSDVDVFAEVYEPVGLTKNDMIEDIRNKVRIITFVNLDGVLKHLSIPSNRFTIKSDVEYKYKETGISINLGNMPIQEDYTELVNDLKAVIKERIGIEVIPDVVTLSSEKLVSADEHASFEAKRKLNKGSDLSYRTELRIVQEKLNDALVMISKLKDTLVKRK